MTNPQGAMASPDPSDHDPGPAPSGGGRLPTAIWTLGFVSLLMDVSSEMIHAVLPVFLVAGLGASALMVGLIEGVSDATANVVKVFSGSISDWLGRRKSVALMGYGLSALSKPLFPVAGSVGLVLGARFVDRIGKGIRGAPRDALIADIAPADQRGAAFGLRQSLDTVGAILGPLIAAAMMATTAEPRLVFALAVIPAALCVLLLAVGVREPTSRIVRYRGFPLRREALAGLGRPFWAAVLAASALMLGRFGEAFLLLRAADVGLAVAFVPLVYVAMNATYAAVAYPVGRLSDRLGRGRILVLGFGLLAASQVALALASGVVLVTLGAVLWGLHMGLSQGVLAALVADSAPEDRRGTAFGVFNLATGLALLAANLLAGLVWTVAGPAATFAAGAVVTLLALGVLLAVVRPGREVAA